ncbi:hypothetical protein [Thermococcus peptonophilus]|uniref:Uncharacterized protein n=1 Tax=Thermococcus peptonophilus TaxID=53952 RepID=A0A142CWJ1_9EURY|nr:hypothetical protein [Thermococcus peptonophilus]AMQ19143.1 hypothetical protein A0127_08190 [Thermococcus peptonophilus]
MKGKNILDDALFEARPYVEYWDRLKELVEKLWEESTDEKNFIELINEEMERADEPFKTDLRIFLQKFAALISE